VCQAESCRLRWLGLREGYFPEGGRSSNDEKLRICASEDADPTADTSALQRIPAHFAKGLTDLLLSVPRQAAKLLVGLAGKPIVPTHL
jgi:hypothetical protein